MSEKFVLETSEKKPEQNLNNYIIRNRNKNYSSSTATVKMSVDFIRFSIKSYQFNNNNFYNLYNVIKSMIVAEPKFRLTGKRGYYQSKTYNIKFNDKYYKIVSTRVPDSTMFPILLTIHDVDESLLLHLQPHLNRLDHHISWVEFTLDFISNVPEQVYQFMLSHLWLKWAGKKNENLIYDTTFYRNDIRKSQTKGLRGYRKQLSDDQGNNVESVRIELLMKRQLLKKKGIQNTSDMLNLNSQLVIKYLTFKHFNYNLFINRLKESGNDQCGVNQLVSLIKETIGNGLLDLSNETALKLSKKNDSDTYLVKHGFHDEFMRNISGLSFLNGDCFNVDIGEMAGA